MTLRTSRATAAAALLAALLPAGVAPCARANAAAAAGTQAPAAPAVVPATADASALYNAGTAALARNDPGPAVVLLLAAGRLDPRAADIRRNLALAEARAAAARGADPSSVDTTALPLSAREAWWLSVALLAAGALLAARWRLSRGPRAAGSPRRRALFVTGHALLAAGIALAAALALHAREEAVHPEAVVVVPSLAAGPAPDERPRPPYLLGAGEIVRLGRTRGALVELLVSGTPIGWAERAGVWRVGEAARYTAGFGGS